MNNFEKPANVKIEQSAISSTETQHSDLKQREIQEKELIAEQLEIYCELCEMYRRLQKIRG